MNKLFMSSHNLNNSNHDISDSSSSTTTTITASLIQYTAENKSKQNQNNICTNVMQDMMIRIKLIRPKTFRAIILFFFIFFLLTFIYYNQPYLVNVFSANKIRSPFIYSVVIDAGSTGSRIHVYRFKRNDPPSQMTYTLVNEDLFHAIKPGLSSYADNPVDAANSLKPLLDLALDKIPTNIQKLTRISLKATAGLRLISEAKANNILKEVVKLFDRYPFYMRDDDVSILDGKYEGIYSWITLNYFKDSFKTSDEMDICSLDLGGGSTQVTYVPSSIDPNTFSQDLVNFKLDKKNYQMFAKSFLGYGLMSARLGIFQTESGNKTSDLTSVCFHSSVKASKWQQQNVDYTLSGHPKTEQNFKDCHENVLDIIENKLNAPGDLKTKNIYAFSFYYDRLVSANLLSENGGAIDIKSILDKAKDVCDPSNNSKYADVKDAQFLCMDLTYIYSLLHNGFNLPLEKSILVHKEINSMEINWALGAAYHMLSD